MPGDGLFDPYPIPPYLTSPVIVVGRFLSPEEMEDEEGQPEFLPMPNVRLVSDQQREGPQPTVARYRFDFSDVNPDHMPRRIEDIFGPSSWGYYRIVPDDHVVSLLMNPDGSHEILNSGFAIAAQGDIGDDGEQVTFECVAGTIREFDRPLFGAIIRHGDQHGEPGEDNANDVQTGRRIRFNPDGRPNAVPEDGESVYAGGGDEENPWTYPVFLDPLMVRDPDVRRHWTLGMAARYIMAAGNRNQTYVLLPEDFMAADDVLVTIKPKTEGGVIDHEDDETYTTEPILVPDLDVTGLAWPDALQRLIEPHGFAMQFVLEGTAGGEGIPRHRLILYRRDANISVKPFYYQRATPGETLDLARTNATRITFQQDNGQLVNDVVVRTALTRREVSVVLAPLFEIDPADAMPENSKKFKREQGQEFTLEGNSKKYRVFGADETGDGHWDWIDTDSFVTDVPPDLDILYSDDPEYLPDQPPSHARQRRPAVQRTLFYEDGGEPVEAELWVARRSTYTDSPIPGVYSRESDADENTWQKVGKGGWKLADDNLGIIITAPDPSSWPIGREKDMAGKPFPAGKLNIVKALADPDDSNPGFIFRLTCVIEGDFGLALAHAPKRPASPTRFTIRKTEDAEDRFRHLVATVSSHYNTAEPSKIVVIEEDTEEARSYATTRQRAHELGTFGGSATIPYICMAYNVGEKISGIEGRDIDFNGMAGQEAGEGRVFPTIVGIDRVYEPKPGTTYHLADLRMEGIPTAQFNTEATKAAAKKSVGGLVVMVSGAEESEGETE